LSGSVYFRKFLDGFWGLWGGQTQEKLEISNDLKSSGKRQ